MGCNVLALAPRVGLALAGNVETRRRLEAAGVEVLTYEGDELSRKGDGGPTCLTRPAVAGALRQAEPARRRRGPELDELDRRARRRGAARVGRREGQRVRAPWQKRRDAVAETDRERLPGRHEQRVRDAVRDTGGGP